MKVPQPMPQYHIFGRPKMKMFSPFPPQSSSPSRIALKTLTKDIDNLVEEMEYNKDFMNGCFNEDDFGKSDFTEAGLIDEMEYTKDCNNGCFNEDDFGKSDFTEAGLNDEMEAVYEEVVYEEDVYNEDTGELVACEEVQGYDEFVGQEQEIGGQEQEFVGQEQEFCGQEQEFVGQEQEFCGQEQEFGGQEQEFGGQEQEFVEQEQDCSHIDEYDGEYGYEEYCGDENIDYSYYY